MEWIKYFETKQEMMEAAGNGNRKRRSEKTDPEVLRDDAQSGKRLRLDKDPGGKDDQGRGYFQPLILDEYMGNFRPSASLVRGQYLIEAMNRDQIYKIFSCCI